LNLRALRTFVSTAESGRLARASAKLNISQPAASRQIQTLETELGIRLFHRVGRTLQLTAEGEDILHQSRRLLADADLLTERAHALKGGETGTLRVAATPHVMATLLAQFLPNYRRHHPDVEVLLMEGGAARQPNRLERGEVHLAIMPVGLERFAGRLLYPVHAVAVFAKTHPLRRHRLVEVDTLANEALLLLRHEFGSRAWFDAACQIANMQPRVLLESGAPDTLVDLAAAGYGVAVLPSTVAIRIDNVRVAPLMQRGASLGRWSMIGWDPQRALPGYAERFVEELIAHSQRAYPGRKFLSHAPALPRPKVARNGSWIAA
jgi:LysR family transcriptional regulator, cyn operon transcriptional activator